MTEEEHFGEKYEYFGEERKLTEQEVKDKVRAVLRLMKPEFTKAVFSSGVWQAYSPSYGNSITLWAFNLPDFDGDCESSLVEREE